MKSVLLLSASDSHGGAARAAYRCYQSLLANAQETYFNPALRVYAAGGNDRSILAGPPDGVPSWWFDFRLIANQLYRARFRSTHSILHSTAWLPSGYLRELNSRNSYYSLVHLHWLGDWMLSIEEIGRLTRPVVWTMHDQWAFLGAEHYENIPDLGYVKGSEPRYSQGYTLISRPSHESGPDINRRTWLRKRRAWKSPIHIICPSQWMADSVRQSALMADWPISVIPNPIDIDFWVQIQQESARLALGLPLNVPLLLFGATGGASDRRKGGDLLFEALSILFRRSIDTHLSSLQLVIFGQDEPSALPLAGFNTRFCGHINDESHLRLLYSAVDAFVIPSRQDNLPNTGLECQACGTPVVAFNTGGLPDVVEDQVTGLLAEPNDPASLAATIESLFSSATRLRRFGESARKRAERLWSPSRIASLHADLYQQVLDSHQFP